MKFLNIYLVLFVIVLFGWWIVSAFDWTQCEEREFVLTAYYSPQKHQAFYYKDTFEQEKKVNGEGMHGASGHPVFNGMLAAPQSYDFGGEIYFPGFWVWKIADRWWAIVEAGERRFDADRIDIWMGKWEEWLVRALDFGVQRKKWYYCSKDRLKQLWVSVQPWFDFSQIPVFAHFFDLALWKQNLWPGRRDVRVYTLQKYLIKLWYLHKNKQNWSFDSVTRKALCRYQTKKMISYPQSSSCGIFGPRTRVVMHNDVKKKWLFPNDLWKHWSVKDIIGQAINWDVAEKIMSEIVVNKQNVDHFFDKPFHKGSYDIKVITLQYLLQYLWYYSTGMDTDGVFDQDVIDAVYAFQLDKWILQWLPSESSLVWYVWPSTRKALNTALEQKHKDEKLAKLDSLLNNKKHKKLDFVFYRAFQKWEWPNAEVRILQKFLSDLHLYTGAIDGKYSRATIDAVYDFQLKYALLSKDSSFTLHGYLWPSTRKKINEMRAFSLSL